MIKNGNHGAMALFAGLGIGATLMYFLDPQRGKARALKTRDRAGDARWALETTRRDLQNRAYGVLAERQNRDDGSVDDTVLVERVRAERRTNATA